MTARVAPDGSALPHPVARAASGGVGARRAASTAGPSTWPARPEEATGRGSGWEIRVLYDALCPLCSREVALLRRLDRGRGRIDFEDITAPDFDPTRYGLDQATVEARLKGVLPDGRVVDGVEVLVRAWSAAGFRFVARLARLPGLRWLLDRAYDTFARNRLAWTGRCDDRCTR